MVKYDFTEMPRDERKKIYDDCQKIYIENYKNRFDWLPNRIEDVTDDNIKAMSNVVGLTGVDITTPFLKLREGILELLKWL